MQNYKQYYQKLDFVSLTRKGKKIYRFKCLICNHVFSNHNNAASHISRCLKNHAKAHNQTKLNAYGIGVDSNQDSVYPGYIVTSAIRDNSSLIEFYVQKYLEGTIEQTEPDVFNLSNGGVGITDMSVIEQYVTNKENFEELKSIIQECKDWIADGTIEVFDARLASVEANGQRLDDWIETSGKFVTYEELKNK